MGASFIKHEGYLLVVAALIAGCSGHARLRKPPSRASQWREGFDNPPDYNDNQGFCGGKMHQNQEMGGKCGICGDPFDGPWPHEAPGGMYANGIIVDTYQQGSWIDVHVEITTNHLGTLCSDFVQMMTSPRTPNKTVLMNMFCRLVLVQIGFPLQIGLWVIGIR